MGTVFSIAISDPGSWDAAIGDVTSWLHRVDALFSTYRADSDISRLDRGELARAAVDPLVEEVLELCEAFSAETQGAFTANLPTGLDPSGLVKGWAVERASLLLRERGSTNHAINGGGDVQTAGESSPGQGWRIGISDPRDTGRLLTVVTGHDLAVATSGTYERGAHIIDPRTGRPADGPASVTVIGASLTRVDVAATAAYVKGPEALAWLDEQPGLEGLVVAADGTATCTRNARTWLA